MVIAVYLNAPRCCTLFAASVAVVNYDLRLTARVAERVGRLNARLFASACSASF